jgi:hypothetical protein
VGLFSTITIAMKCDGCAHVAVTEVQFKYGNLHDHAYGLGSAIVWGRTQVGRSDEQHVVVDGIADLFIESDSRPKAKD